MTRIVLVTGGSSGIGKKIVERFTKAGDDVVVVDRNEPDGRGRFLRCDLSDEDSIRRLADGLTESVDVLVNAAGISGLAPISTVMRVNFFGLRALTETIADRINSGGAVVNVASTSSWYWRNHLEDIAAVIAARGESAIESVCADLIDSGHAAYERSKEAVLVWTTVAAQQFMGRFRVNSVSPGPVETPLLADFYEAMGHEELDPLTARAGGRNGRPEEIANVVFFLASADSHWINGTDIPVDNSAEMSEFLATHRIIPPLEKT